MRKSLFCLLAITLLSPIGAFARERTLCEGDGCTDNKLRVVFGEHTEADTALSTARANTGDTINITIVADVVEAAQGWSFSFKHDPDKLSVDNVTIERLTLPAEFFNTTTVAVGDPAPGFVAAYVTAIFPPPGDSLMPGNSIPLVEATYTVTGELDEDDPTFLEFADDLIPNPGSPPTATNFTIDSQTKKPATVEDGELRKVDDGGGDDCPAPGYGLFFGTDYENDLDITENTVSINMRNAADALGLSFGVTHVDGAFNFASEVLGTAADRLIENIITDAEGNSNTPVSNAANDAQMRAIVDIAKGSAIANIEGDFFNADMNPAVGGPGFTVGYVVDVTGSGTVLPATGGTEQDCEFNEIVVLTLEIVDPGECDAYELSFGDNSTLDTVDLGADIPAYSIYMNNSKEALGFSVAVARDGTSLTFVDDVLGALEGREVDLIITDVDGISQTPSTNSATGPDKDAQEITKGAAIAAIADDFLTVDLEPAVGGMGYTVGYVADTSGTGATIPATGDDCAGNEILVVSFDGIDPEHQNFLRGDCDGNGELNVSDGAISAQNIFLNRIKFFDCDDMLDANDDGQLDGSDTITILSWVFLGAADLNAPFVDGCGQDDDEDLTCLQSNCDV